VVTLHYTALPRRATGINIREDFNFPSRCICGFRKISTINRGVYRVLVRKPEGKRPLGRPRRRWEDNNKMDLQGVECEGKDWMDLVQDRDRWRAVVHAVMNLRVP
jgi:hypothetical protein